MLTAPWTIADIVDAIGALPRNKASGPDGVLNEHLMQSGAIVPHITALMNACLETGSIPAEWRKCLLAVIPKSKGDVMKPSPWRGIAKRNVMGKLLSSLVARRLEEYLSFKKLIPIEQHGFTRGRSTLSAVEILLDTVRRSLEGPRGSSRPVFAVFIDYRSAFDLASRSLILDKLARAGVGGPMLRLIYGILQQGSVALDDGVSVLPDFPLSTL